MDTTAPARHSISVVLDGPPAPRWQQRALDAIRARASLEVRDVHFAGVPGDGRLRAAHASIERRLFAAGPDAMARADLAGQDATARADPGGPEAMARADFAGQDATARAASGTVETGADGQVDLVVWLAESSRADVQGPPVLELRHEGRREGADAAFRRAVLRNGICVRTDVVLREGDEEKLVEWTVSGARPYSVTLSRDKALWKIAEMTARAAERAFLHDPAATAAADPVSEPPPSRAPGAAELLARSSWRWLRIVTSRFLYDRPWQVRVRGARADPLAEWQSAGEDLVAWRPGHLYADPFVIEHEGSSHLFCEEIPRGASRAVISHVELRQGERSAPPEPVLVEPHHLSYPFVFAHEGELFLIPETSAQRRVTLYRAEEFPRRWVRERVLLEGLIASDATLLFHDGRVWLFVGVAAEHATMLDELHLFVADSLSSEWRAHPRNPIVSDVRCARPAGAIQRWDGALVRPGQDCSRRYGGAVSFRRIDVLSEQDYAEHEIARLDPVDVGPRARATHTYAAGGPFEAIDLRERIPRSPAEARRIARRVLRGAWRGR